MCPQLILPTCTTRICIATKSHHEDQDQDSACTPKTTNFSRLAENTWMHLIEEDSAELWRTLEDVSPMTLRPLWVNDQFKIPFV